VHRLPIDLPWPTEPVNAYLVEDEPLTLLDTGPNLPEALAALERALAAHGRRVEDVERIVLTHQHIDHVGLASEVRRRSGAEVCAHALLVPWLARQPSHAERDRAFTAELMKRGGVPAGVAEALLSAERALDDRDPSVTVTRELREDDELEFAERRWRVLHAPGHSPFDTLFFDAERGELFSGDHLLPNISSNPVMTVAPNLPPSTPFLALREYRASLRRTRELPAETVNPGHGEIFGGHRSAIDERFEEMDRRRERIAALIEERARTPHEVARAIWGSAALEQPHLTLYEVLGYADLLVEDGRVSQEPDGDVTMLVASS
jgi:glyoxylase-like metal-dependent hydrolase (beta-lactamase superfamily II)